MMFKKKINVALAGSLMAIGLTLSGHAMASFMTHEPIEQASSNDLLLQSFTQGSNHQLATSIVVAVGLVDRVDRRVDRRDNARDRVDDKQDFREERRDCVGEGADCRSDNRQDKRGDAVDRADERIDDRRDRRF
ncbi:MAG: hypothetical protein U9N50_04975 [Pseudomonadota bacterium]|nr:hypothetical protein [Pseudomonadota bacterium]